MPGHQRGFQLGKVQLGIAFGAHANAYTSFDETVYMLDLPNLEEATLDLAFNVMRDFGDGALHKITFDSQRKVKTNTIFAKTDHDYTLAPSESDFLAKATHEMRNWTGFERS